MEYQDFKYKVLEHDGYTIAPYNKEYSYSHEARINQDDHGQIITIYTELKFDHDKKIKVIMGQIVYYIPFDNTYNNINKIVPELIYQNFAKQTGYIFAKYNIIVKTIPNVLTIYNELMASELKSTK